MEGRGQGLRSHEKNVAKEVGAISSESFLKEENEVIKLYNMTKDIWRNGYTGESSFLLCVMTPNMTPHMMLRPYSEIEMCILLLQDC